MSNANRTVGDVHGKQLNYANNEWCGSHTAVLTGTLRVLDHRGTIAIASGILRHPR